MGATISQKNRAYGIRSVECMDWRGIYRVGSLADQWPRHRDDGEHRYSNKLMGIVGIRKEVISGYAWWMDFKENKIAELGNIVVEPEERRHFLGSGLFLTLVSYAKHAGSEILIATVDENDEVAIDFLSSCEMRATRVCRDYFPGKHGLHDGYRFELAI